MLGDAARAADASLETRQRPFSKVVLERRSSASREAQGSNQMHLLNPSMFFFFSSSSFILLFCQALRGRGLGAIQKVALIFFRDGPNDIVWFQSSLKGKKKSIPNDVVWSILAKNYGCFLYSHKSPIEEEEEEEKKK